MRLANPYFLLLLLLIPGIIWLRYFLSRRSTVQFSNAVPLRALSRTWRHGFQFVFPTLLAAGLACLIIALARPQQGLDDSRIRTEAVDIILLLDLSESMDTRDFAQFNKRISRLDASKDVIERFLQKRPDDRIGMVGFATIPYAVAPLTLDHGWLVKRMEGLHTRMLDGRRTAIGDGIASAVNRLRESEAKSRIIILLTDGSNNWGTLSPENAAEAAAALNIKIYTIGAGGAGQGFMLGGSEVDETTLKKIAQTTSAQFYRARDLKTLDDVYAQIDQLEKTEIEVESYTRYREKAGGWIFAGIVLVGLEQLLSLTKLGRIP
ncbi:MAG: VWA domain-containing protein [Pontiellaceae bacterium]|nr:VWA domain-containing protein [Pontiellaceae bacterium]MBN2786618.1 VWA domain-containing protein [Pontiellaceae bacterium]